MTIVGGSFTHPESVKFASFLAVVLAQCRFHIYGDPECLEEAIFHIHAYLRMLSSEDPACQAMTWFLEQLKKACFDEFSVASNLQAADASDAEVNNCPSPLHLFFSLPTTRPDIGEVTPMTQGVEDTHDLQTLI